MVLADRKHGVDGQDYVPVARSLASRVRYSYEYNIEAKRSADRPGPSQDLGFDG